MAHKVILPPKKNYIPQFLKQRDINSYIVTAVQYREKEGWQKGLGKHVVAVWADDGGKDPNKTTGIKLLGLSYILYTSSCWKARSKVEKKYFLFFQFFAGVHVVVWGNLLFLTLLHRSISAKAHLFEKNSTTSCTRLWSSRSQIDSRLSWKLLTKHEISFSES